MRIPTAWWLVAAVSLVIAGCGGGGGGTTCTTNCVSSTLSVATVSPANGATGVAVTAVPMVTFSQSVNISTLTSSTFTLTPQGGAPVAATVASLGPTAQLTPTAPLAYNTTYTATLTTGVQSIVGTALASNYTWSFTTGSLPTPAVSSVTPTNGLTGVNIASTVTATFNQAMDSSTITSSTFTLTPNGGSPIAATVHIPRQHGDTYAERAVRQQHNLYGDSYHRSHILCRSSLAANDTWTFTTVTATVKSASHKCYADK